MALHFRRESPELALAATKDARLQINQIGSAFCFRPCGQLQHAQRATAFDQLSEAVSNRSDDVILTGFTFA
jgi:hypothetical protein